MRTEFKNKLKEAISLIDTGKVNNGIKLLFELHMSNPKSSEVLVVLGLTLWEEGELNKAIKYFKKGILIEPSTRALSLGLFHTLWETNQVEDALKEIKRFLLIEKCNDYLNIINELYEDDSYRPILEKLEL